MQPLAFFLPSTQGGGAEKVMMTLSRAFASNECSVDLIVANGARADTLFAGRTIDFRVSRVGRSVIPLCKYLKRSKPLVLVSTLYHANIVAVIAKYLTGSKTKLLVREANIINRPLGRSRLMDWITRRLMKLTYRYADKVIAVSKGVKEELISELGVPREKVTVIYNPVATEEILDKAKTPVTHPWFELNPKIILNVARLEKGKDHQTLLRALKIVRRSMDACLLIIGEGGERANIEGCVNELGLTKYVDLIGYDDNPYRYMTRSDVFVLSSVWEGLPNVLLEAIACNTPIVSTDCSTGPTEILKNGRYGKLVPVKNPAALANAIVDTIRSSKIHYPNGALEKFRVSNVVERYKQEILGLLGGDGGMLFRKVSSAR